MQANYFEVVKELRLPAEWVVVFETVASPSERFPDVRGLQRVLAALPDIHAIGLHVPGRYAVQLQIAASGEAEAVFLALARWRTAVETVGGPPPQVVRTEVLTLEEFERDCRLAYSDTAETGAGDVAAPPLAGPAMGDGLLRQAFNDPLTLLAARCLFMNHLEHALIDGRRQGAVHTVVVLGLNGLTAVNEQFGQAGGDEVLVTTARRLSDGLGQERAVGRIGGDQFAVLLEHTSEADAIARLEPIIETLGRAMVITGGEVGISATQGVASSEPELDADTLIARAVAAMFAAKELAKVDSESYGPVLDMR